MNFSNILSLASYNEGNLIKETSANFLVEGKIISIPGEIFKEMANHLDIATLKSALLVSKDWGQRTKPLFYLKLLRSFIHELKIPKPVHSEGEGTTYTRLEGHDNNPIKKLEQLDQRILEIKGRVSPNDENLKTLSQELTVISQNLPSKGLNINGIVFHSFGDNFCP